MGTKKNLSIWVDKKKLLGHPVLTSLIVAISEAPPISPVLTRAHSGQYSQLSFGIVGPEGELLQPEVKDHNRAKMSSFTCILVQFQDLKVSWCSKPEILRLSYMSMRIKITWMFRTLLPCTQSLRDKEKTLDFINRVTQPLNAFLWF